METKSKNYELLDVISQKFLLLIESVQLQY